MSMLLTGQRRLSTEEMLFSAPGAPSTGSYLSAHLQQGFDRTTTGRALEERTVFTAEKAEGTYDDAYLPQQEARDMFGAFPSMPPLQHAHALTEEQWKASPHFRKDIPYRPDMTETRARIMAEHYDARRYLDDVVQRGDAAFDMGTKAAGLGAVLLGGLPDPINFIPFGGGIQAAKLAAGGGIMGAVKAGARAGMMEGAVGALAVDAMTLPDLASRGEDVGFADALLDTAFGAMLGGVLGGLGGTAAGFAKKRAAAHALGLAEAQPAEGAHFGQSPVAGRADVLPTPEGAGPASLLPRNDAADLLRAGISPRDKRNILRGMEKALLDMEAGRPVDVSQILQNTSTITTSQYKNFIFQLNQADDFTNVRFGKLRPDLREALNSIRTEEGVSLLDGEDLIIPSNVVKKFYEKRVLEGKMSPDEVGQLLLDVFHRDADFTASTKYPHIQAVAAIRDDLSRVGFISTNPKTGEIVIKSGYKKETPRLMRELGGGGSNSGGARNPSSGDGAETPPFAAPRLSALQSGKPVSKIIDARRREVNFSVEQPENFSPAPGLDDAPTGGTADVAPDAALDPQNGLLPEEIHAAELDAAGRISPEERDILLAAQGQTRRVAEYDEIGQSVIPCILEVVE